MQQRFGLVPRFMRERGRGPLQLLGCVPVRFAEGRPDYFPAPKTQPLMEAESRAILPEESFRHTPCRELNGLIPPYRRSRQTNGDIQLIFEV